MKINQPTEFQGKENFQKEGKRMREDAGFIGETLWVSSKILPSEHEIFPVGFPQWKQLFFLCRYSLWSCRAQNIFGTDAGRVDRPNKF